MNTLKILVQDKLIMVDGVAMHFNLDDLIDADIWAVSFDNDKGEVEYIDPERENETINHVGPYQEIIDRHASAYQAMQAQQAEIEASNQAEAAALQLKLDGFDYKGTAVSFTEPDRRTVAEANAAFDKQTPAGDFYLADGVLLRMKFQNGNEIRVDRIEFDNEFFPQFFARASADFL